MRAELAVSDYRKVPLGRRAAAASIDFATVGLLSLLLGTSVIALAFCFLSGWLAMRVVLVSKNRGQSLGRWALDMRVVNVRLGGTPDLQSLVKREAVLGCGALLLLIGLVSLSPGRPWALLLFLPIAADCSLAAVDRQQQQTFHDQIAQTRIVQSRHGYSLDLKLKRLVAQAQRRVK